MTLQVLKFGIMSQFIETFSIAVLLGIIFSNYAEILFSDLAERIMNLLSGFGLKKQDAEFNKEGIPIVSLRKLGTLHYNAVTVANAADNYYSKWKLNNDRYQLEMFKNCIDSLITNLKIKKFNGKEYGIWEYDYKWSYNLVPPWISGLAQGLGVAVLSKAWFVFKDENYQRNSKLALSAFFVDVKNGGVTYKDSEDQWWFEEYVGQSATESRALNGMIYSILGIIDYYKITNDPEALVLFEKGLASLKKNLSKYDAGWWSFYDILGTIAAKSYHILHIDLIKKLNTIVPDDQFLHTYRKWEKYKKHFFVREFVKQKPSWHDFMVLLLNISLIFILVCILRFIMSI